MLRIAICDDDIQDCKRIQEILFELAEDYNADFDIDIYRSGEELCLVIEQKEDNYYDIIFFDIIMQGITGITAAERVRELGSGSTKIIFVSGFDEYLRELYHIGTTAFLDKPFTNEQFKKVFNRVYKTILSEDKLFFEFNKNRMQESIRNREILYFESRGHLIRIHLHNATQIEYYDSLQNVWRQVKGNPYFVMPSKSFVVNLSHIKGITPNMIKLVNGQTISIGRSFKEQTMERYFKLIGSINRE